MQSNKTAALRSNRSLENEYWHSRSEMRALFMYIRFINMMPVYPFCIVFSWNKTKDPEPWNKLDPTYQYKVIYSTHTHTSIQCLEAWVTLCDTVIYVFVGMFGCRYYPPDNSIKPLFNLIFFFPSLWPSPQTTKTSRRRDLTSKPHYSEWKSQKILIWTKIHSPSPPHCSWKVKRILAQDPEASLVIIWWYCQRDWECRWIDPEGAHT